MDDLLELLHLKFELLSHGNDFKVWGKQNLLKSYFDV